MLLRGLREAPIEMTVKFDGLALNWLGYACARVSGEDGPVVYTDPGRYGTLDGTWAERYGGIDHPSGPQYDATDGDVVLVTHDHHYDSDGVQRVAAPDATVIVYEGVDASRIGGSRAAAPVDDLPYDIKRVAYGDTVTVGDVDIDVVPAYSQPDGPNTDADGNPGHPYGFGCGFRFRVADKWLFWTGDSDVVDEHADLDVDVFMPSIARSITMNRYDAADLAETLSPELVVPIHYNTFDGLRSDSEAFAADVAGRAIPVALDESWG